MMQQTPTLHRAAKLRVAVIGGGWAGLAAAEALAAQADVVVFEAGKALGGRARGLPADGSGLGFLDNGQHLLMGAYRQCLALLERAGMAESDAFLRLPLTWHMADGIRFQAARLPAPWHLLAGILRGKGMTLAEKTALIRQMRALQRWHWRHERGTKPDISVAHWLRQQQVSQKGQQQFWQPLVWGCLNTDLAAASTARLGHVLADGVWQCRNASDMLIAKGDLSRSWVRPLTGHLQRLGVQIQRGRRVQTVCRHHTGRWQVGDGVFDRVIVALAPYHVAAVLPEDTPTDVPDALVALSYHAITTVYLRYAQPVSLPQPLTGLVGGTAQWLIDRGALGGSNREVAAVISLSDQYGVCTPQQWAEAVHQDVLRLCPGLAPPLAARALTEKRATVQSRVAATPIPQAWLRSKGIYLAGDYLHPRYPATLEGAVQSGQMAAAACLADWPPQPQPQPGLKRV